MAGGARKLGTGRAQLRMQPKRRIGNRLFVAPRYIGSFVLHCRALLMIAVVLVAGGKQPIAFSSAFQDWRAACVRRTGWSVTGMPRAVTSLS